ncbi:MAG: hypothetical protein ACP5IN_02655 [Caldimicrobium sp.]
MNIASNFSDKEIREIIREIFEKELEKRISEIIERKIIGYEKSLSEVSLLERIIKVEEELKALREIQIEMMKLMEKRFEALQREMDKRFEAMEKRFEAMDMRFEAMEKRFEALQREMDKRFEAMEKRFNFMQKLIAGGFTLLTILITLLKLFG